MGRKFLITANGVDYEVRKLFKELKLRDLTIVWLAAKSGVSEVTIRRWKRGVQSPTWSELKACLNSVGYEVLLKRIGEP